MKVIEVENLSKHFNVRLSNGLIKGLIKPEFRQIKAVENISFTLERGEAVGFLGPNGAGKTTTTKMLTGLIYPTSGSISVLGYTPFERKPEFLKRIGLVMGNKSGLNWDLTPNQSFDLLKNIYDIPENRFKNRLSDLSELLEVKNILDIQLRRLSLGERMKVELIGAILHDPEVLFLDEPTIGLDIISKKNIRQFLKKIPHDFQTTLILTSHDIDDIEEVCQRAIIINHGTKVYDDSLAQLKKEFKDDRYVCLVFNDVVEKNPLLKFGEVEAKSDGSFLVKVKSNNLVELLSFACTKDLIDTHIESVPLEEIISEIYKRK